MARHPEPQGLARHHMGRGIRRPRLDTRAKAYLRRRMLPRLRPPHRALRPQHAGPGAASLRLQGTAGLLPAAHPRRNRLVVSGLFRTGGRLRPRQPENPRRARGRSLHHQRPEDMDHAGPARQHDLLPLPHRSRRETAGRHQLHPRRPCYAGYRDAPHPPDRGRARGERGLLHRRPRPRRQSGGRGKQGLDHRQIPAHP